MLYSQVITTQGFPFMVRHVTTALLVVLSLLGMTNFSATLSAQEVAGDFFPYQAIVRTEDAPVHSGPGRVHYVTMQLRQGTTVEVYRHDPGGWCAIRPPKGSFSLIPATAIEELGNAVGEVAEQGTQAWVGTQLGPVEKPLWQVKLRAGEKVALLGIATWPDPDGFTMSWYQIAPPAGEFRWIKLDDLNVPPSAMKSNDSPNAVAATPIQSSVQPSDFQSETGATDDVAMASFQSQVSRAPERRQAPETEVVNSSNSGWRKARFPIEKPNSSPASSLDSFGSSSGSSSGLSSGLGSGLGSGQPPERFAAASGDSRYDMTPVSITGPVGSFTSSSGFSSATLTPRMTELELKLNQEMVKEPSQWRIVDLKSAAERIVASSSDGVEQVQAQRFLTKLENCRQLRDQFIQGSSQRVSRGSGQGFGASPPPSGLSGNTAEADLSLDTLYDAHGWLKELVRDGGRSDPAYVLQDESGKVTHHVSPGPGMNLSSYVSKRIGIIGQRGYHTRLKLDHVTVHKVIELKPR